MLEGEARRRGRREGKEMEGGGRERRERGRERGGEEGGGRERRERERRGRGGERRESIHIISVIMVVPAYLVLHSLLRPYLIRDQPELPIRRNK